MATLARCALLSLVAPGLVAAGSLADIQHVVLFMQENRAFDHYFGTMAGVRGFKDPNVQVNPNSQPNVFYQNVDSSLSTSTDYLLPWYLNYQNGTFPLATQCMVAGDNGYQDNHAALNNDLNTNWAMNNTPYSWGHYQRQDLPVHFGIAEGWTVGDMYQESVIASTNPNRVSWTSGSINVPGSPQKPSQGGVYFDNNESPGCEAPDLNCYPLKWKTAPEYYQDAGVTWQVYQDKDNFDDNPLAWFKQYQTAKAGTPLHSRGMSFVGLDKFYSDCAANTLPEVSYIVGPAELSEHPPYQPKDGAWLQQQVLNALTKSPSYNTSVLIVSYDETGGWGDHVTPFHAPPGTAGEWLEDPYKIFGQVYSGPGFRVPFYIVSPWTRGGHVFTANADHTSQIKFVEQWLLARGKTTSATSQIPPWRRANMDDLTQAFDFTNPPDFSLPSIPTAETPSQDNKGNYNGYATCLATYPTQRPAVPYGSSKAPQAAPTTEQGFKSVRGALTEGRFLTLEMNGYGLANKGASTLSTAKAGPQHQAKSHRFVVHAVPGQTGQFTLQSALDGRYVGKNLALAKGAAAAVPFVVASLGAGKGYSVKGVQSGMYLGINAAGVLSQSSRMAAFALYSVTYDD